MTKRRCQTLTLTLIVLLAGVACAQEESESSLPAEKDPVLASWKKSPGVASCGECHYGTKNAFSSRSQDFCRLNELKFWLANDKHAIARRRVEPLSTEAILEQASKFGQELIAQGIEIDSGTFDDWWGESNRLSLSICESLGYEIETDQGYATFRDRCLNCHGGYSDSSQDAYFAAHGPQQPGISCNYCHQIENNEVWVDQHSGTKAKETWRLLPPSKKAAAGMRDLVSVSGRASLCNDCHIGNIGQGRFVTHAMYAAGHPPLPSIELQTFIDAMPKHWRDTSELLNNSKFEQADEYAKTNFPETSTAADGNHADVFWNTRQLLIGAIESRIHAVRLYVDANSGSGKHSVDPGDFALYDCAACHHALQIPSARQRVRSSVPGRPLPPQWPRPLFDVALSVAGARSAAIETLNARFQRPFELYPFGKPDQVATAAEAHVASLKRAVSLLRNKNVDHHVAHKTLVQIASLADANSDVGRTADLLDYHSARQVVWAIRAIASDLERHGNPLPKGVVDGIERLEGGQNERIVNAKLPSGRNEFIYRSYLEKELTRQSQYSSVAFKKRLASLSQMLANSPVDDGQAD